MAEIKIDGYAYESGALNTHSHSYLLPALLTIVDTRVPNGGRLFDLGCGNGSIAAEMDARGFQVKGIDPSAQGIEKATAAYPKLDLQEGSAYDPLAERYGQFPLVYSLEVVEHVYAPRDYARTLADLIEPGGTAVVSTPYHSYWKNLALAVTGKMDAHFSALWDNGHIKFWSVPTLTSLLAEVGLQVESVCRVGRVQALAKSMILVARKT